MNPRQIIFILAVAFFGVLAGGLIGSQRDAGYETTHTVALDAVVRSSNLRGTRLVSFITTMRQPATRQRAAEASGLELSDFNGIFASRVNDSMVIEVRAIGDDPNPAAVRALIEAALLDTIETERASEQVIVDSTATEVAELEAELRLIHDEVNVPFGIDLADRLARDQFGLVASEEELGFLPSSAIDLTADVRGDVEAFENRIEAISPVLERWAEIDERLDQLDTTHGDAVRRIVELESSDEIATSGTAVLSGEPSPRSARLKAGRWAAAFGAVGFVSAMAFVLVGSAIAARSARELAEAES